MTESAIIESIEDQAERILADAKLSTYRGDLDTYTAHYVFLSFGAGGFETSGDTAEEAMDLMRDQVIAVLDTP